MREMRKTTSSGNMISRQSRLRRVVYFLFILTAFILCFARAHQYYSENGLPTFALRNTARAFNKYVDQDGLFLPSQTYKILQHVINPLHQTFVDLYYFLDQQNDLRLYFKLVPVDSYHVILADLRDRASLKDDQIKLLNREQELLDINLKETRCSGKQLFIIDRQEIRLEIQFPSDYLETYLSGVQKRWQEKIASTIVHQYTSFYITLAIQHRNFPTQNVLNQLDQALKEWKYWPVDIELDPIEICSYTSPISYAPIWPPTIEL